MWRKDGRIGDEMTIWIEVTRDKYELPIHVADTAKELAEMSRCSTNNIYSAISHYRHRNQSSAKFYKVEIDEDE